MRARHFVIGVVVGMVGLAASWFLAVDHWLAVSPPPVSWSYKQFLLENVPAPRLIIVAGSNAHYSIDPAVLERRYRVPVINLADNGSYPLTHKLYNLLRYARSGDLVIMPLEWSQYALPGPLSAEYVEALFDARYTFYYAALPWLKRLQLAFHDLSLPVLQTIMAHRWAGRWQVDQQSVLFRLRDARNSLNSGGAVAQGGKLALIAPAPPLASTIAQGCDGYLFEDVRRAGWRITSAFTAALPLVSALQQRGVSVIFAWPAVVNYADPPCYASVEQPILLTFQQQVRETLAASGQRVIGDPEDSHFDRAFFLDTYYHITAPAAGERTRRLIAALDAAGVIPPAGRDFAVAAQLGERLDALEAELLAAGQAALIEWDGRSLDAGSFTRRVLFDAGWNEPEPWGLWSQGHRSRLYFRTPSGLTGDLLLRIEGDYFAGEEATELRVNGVPLGSRVLRATTWRIPATLLADRPIVEIELHHHNPRSPADLGQGADQRLLKFGLKQLAWRVAP